MLPNPEFDIRYSEPDDLTFLQKWFHAKEACDSYPFGVAEKDDALKNWIGFAKYKASLTGLWGGAPCAIGTLFLMPYKKVAHHCSFYIIVDSEHRRKGIGTSMVKNLLHLAKSRFRLESVHVEIFEPSALHSLLQKLQFELVAKQENFIKVQGEPRARLVLEHYF